MRGRFLSEFFPFEVAELPEGGEAETCRAPRVRDRGGETDHGSGRIATETEEGRRPPASSGTGARILIVDGETEDREGLSSILRREGYLSEEVESGEEAFARIREGDFDLALIGIKLPDEDGIELIWPLKEIQPDLAVIMMTAPASLETSVRALNEGAWAYIVKPPDREELLATVLQARERQKLIRENASLAVTVKRELSHRQRTEAELRALRRRIADYADREQERIGQELHDVLGQQLTGAGLIAKSIQNRAEDQGLGDLREDTVELVKSIQEAQEEVRRLARGHCPVQLDSRGLMVALDDLVVSSAKRTGVQVFLECDGQAFIDNAEISNHLYHIAQEAVSNAVRHGDPDRIVVGLHTRNGRISLEVRDNGRGFSGETTGKEGMGLRIMRYRAERIGARLSIDSSPEKGTVVSCILSEWSLST